MPNTKAPREYSEHFTRRANASQLKRLNAQYPNLPFTPTMARFDELVAHLKHQPIPEKDYGLRDDELVEVAKEAMRLDCSPRVIMAAGLLCLVNDKRSLFRYLNKAH